MSTRLYRLMFIIVATIMSLLGCNETTTGTHEEQPEAEYGAPSILYYSIDGQVITLGKDPIPGIEITMPELPDEDIRVLTDQNGAFSLRIDRNLGSSISSCEKQRFLLRDIDGPLNGGVFASKELNMSFRQVHYDTWQSYCELPDMKVVLLKEENPDDDTLLNDDD